MYVRLIRRVTEEKAQMSLRECRELVFNTPDISDDLVHFDLIGHGWADSYEWPKAETEIYVMNNDGKTIDTYRWK